MDFKSAMLELLRANPPTLRVIPKGNRKYICEMTIRYCEELGQDILMSRYVPVDGNEDDWEPSWQPIAYILCDDGIVDGDWEVASNKEVEE